MKTSTPFIKTLPLLLLLLAAGGFCRPAAAINFALDTESVKEDGFLRHRTYFSLGPGERIYVDNARNWVFSGNAAVLNAAPRGQSYASFKMERSPLKPAQAFDAPNLEIYRKNALGELPANAAGGQILAEIPDALPLFGWKAYEFISGFQLFAQRCKTSVIFVNINSQEQLRVVTTAPEEHFAAMRQTAIELLSSYQKVPVDKGAAQPR